MIREDAGTTISVWLRAAQGPSSSRHAVRIFCRVCFRCQPDETNGNLFQGRAPFTPVAPRVETLPGPIRLDWTFGDIGRFVRNALKHDAKQSTKQVVGQLMKYIANGNDLRTGPFK